MKIEKPAMEELADIVKMYKDAAKKMDENNIFQWDDKYPTEDILRNDIVKNEMYAIKINNEIVFLVVYNKECDDEYADGKWQYNKDKYVVLHRICVRADYQNKGIGTKAMLKIEEYLKNNNIESIRLDAFSKNPTALRMYEKLGYKKTGEMQLRMGVFYLMEKVL